MPALTDSITCPNCGKRVPLSKAIAHELEEHVQGEVERAVARKEAEVEERLSSERQRAEAEAVEHARERVATELADLRATALEKEEQLRDARGELLDLRKEKRALEEQRESLELEVARRLDRERAAIASNERKRLEEAHQLSLREKDLQLEHMREQIEDLKRASEQTKPSLQGEVLVREIEDLLREKFPTDQVRVVKVGAKGADIVQTVRSFRGHDCGEILWESKRTRNWNNAWVPKLKADQKAEGAELAVIVTTSLPVEVSSVDYRDGVWIVHPSCAIGFAVALRERLIDLAQARTVDQGRNQVGDVLYDFVSSKEFRDRMIEGANVLIEMQNDLDAEKRAYPRMWAKKETTIKRGWANLGGMYGELQSIMGSALGPVQPLELPESVIELPAADSSTRG